MSATITVKTAPAPKAPGEFIPTLPPIRFQFP
jgi:hypothetical protein